MATSTDSNPPAKDRGPANTATASGSDPAFSPIPDRDPGRSPVPDGDPGRSPAVPAASGAGRPPRPGAPSASSSPRNPSPGRTPPPPAKPGDSNALSGIRNLSSANESQVERSILRRGLATTQEIELCKAHRAKLAAQDKKRSVLEIMVGNNILTPGQARRLLQEINNDQHGNLEIPGYQIIGKIGKGSMGMVYKARQTSVDRVVAIKVLLDALAQNREFIKRFDREAKIAAKLSHNNIVNAIDAGEVAGRHFFVMEFIEGQTIKDELDKGNVYEEKAALKIIMAVAEALKHAHQRGLIHRDVKPENVILTREGNVKLADLGLARPIGDENWAMAEAGMAIGTPYYISPEQVRGQVDVDIRADIYSLGATLYHMVTGKVPYEGTSPTEVMRQHVDKNATFTPPDHINTSLSSGLGEVVETMMAKNRENRYRNPDDLILDLKCLLGGERPLLAEQKASTLAKLDQGETRQGEGGEGGGGASEAQLVEIAGYVNAKDRIITALLTLLGLSIVTNVVFLALG